MYITLCKSVFNLPDAQLGKLFRAIVEYQDTGKDVTTPDLQIALNFFIERFKVDKQAYEERCQKNRESINIRWKKKADTNEYD